MTDTVYNTFASSSKKKWLCDRVDCVAGDRSSLAILSSQTSDMLKIGSNLVTKDEIVAISGGIEELKENMKDINRKLNKFEPRIKAYEERLDELE